MLPQRVLIIAFLAAALIFLVRLFEMKYLTGKIPNWRRFKSSSKLY